MTIPRVQFVNGDFDTFLDDILFRLKTRWGNDYSDYSESAFGMMLADQYALVGEQLAWLIDRRASEGFLATATQRTSVERAVRQLGYRMSPAASSSGSVQVAPKAGVPFVWSVPVGFQFVGPSGLVFEATQAVSWAAMETSAKMVQVREGQTQQVTATATGVAFQEVQLPAATNGKAVVADSVQVWVNGSEWTEVEFLDFSEADQFEVHYASDPPFIRFGDGVSGRLPPLDADIRVRFVLGSADAGNARAGTIKSTVRPLIVAFTTIELNVNNPSPTTGGSPVETIEEARARAPAFYASRGVAVTALDYQTLAEGYTDPQFGRAARATAYVARSLTTDGVALGLVSVIRESVTTAYTSLSADIDGAQSDADDAQAALADVATLTADFDADRAAVTTRLGAAETSVRDAQAHVEALAAAQTDLDEVINNTESTYGHTLTQVATYLTGLGGGSVAYGTSASQMAARLTTLLADVGAALTAGRSSLTAALAAIRSASAANTQAGVNWASISDDIALVATAIDDAEVRYASMRAEVALGTSGFDTALTGIVDHVEAALQADCKANLVTVPILAIDADRFYAAPSVGLMESLQVYLQARCDVAHLVQVTDGSSQLIAAHAAFAVKRTSAYTFQEIAAKIEAAFRNLCRGRDFGQSLTIHSLHVLAKSIPGVAYANISISGDADFLDADGNLIADQQHLVTFGSISIVEITE